MKEETQIAKENVEDLKRVQKFKLKISLLHYSAMCLSHFTSCERFLGFLESIKTFRTNTSNIMRIVDMKDDLQSAIKVYEDSGIKWQ